MDIRISIQTEDFSVDQELKKLGQSGESGAVVVFIGKVRDVDKTLEKIHIEHYPGMTEERLFDIAMQATKRWDVHAIRICHRVGDLYPNDNIVMVLVSGKHRHNTYTANTFVMDYLKNFATLWKKEHLKDQAPYWVEAKDSDLSAVTNW